MVGGLDTEAEDSRTESEKTKTVTITMSVEGKEEENAVQADAEAIKTKAGGANLDFLEITVEKKVDTVVGDRVTDTQKESVAETRTVMEIILPYDFSNKINVTVYRRHGTDDAQALTALTQKPDDSEPFKDGEFWADSANGCIYIYATKFSTYAVGYQPPPSYWYAPTYPPTIPTPEHGTASISPSAPERGEKVTVTVKPDPGYEVDDVTVTGPDGKPVPVTDNGDGTYSFTQPGGRVTINATFKPAAGAAGDPAATGVASLLNTDEHIVFMVGYSAGLFGPADKITRAQVAQVFYNLMRDQNVSGAPYDDVPADAWYAKAASAMRGLGVMNGVGGNRFEPDRPITRGEFAVTAMRFAKLPEAGENIFSDVNEADWYYEQIVGAARYGWINGYGDGTYRPKDPIIRAEVVKIVNKMLGRSPDETYIDDHQDELRRFLDLKKAYWAYYEIMEAVNPHKYEKDEHNEEWIG